ncbi:MAG: alpha/beta fold hydrolase [Bacteroidetes bacterium]|nr:MAG: alpha/beta fold hydrolase [Bacteroidota bacterium]
MQLNHKIFGQGPPLIILHGLFGSLDNWQTLAKRWAEDFTVLLIDQRNHGRSPHTEAHTYPLMAQDLQAFMVDNGLPMAHILGHSMGGKTAMQFALQHPDMVDKLVVVDIAPKTYPPGHTTIINALHALDLDQISNRSMADEQLARSIAEPGVRQFLLKNLTRNPECGYRWKINLPTLTQYYPHILKNIELDGVLEKPALFIRGDRSDYIKDEDLLTILEHFPQARLETVKSAGHWVHAEQPDTLYHLVRDFLVAP